MYFEKWLQNETYVLLSLFVSKKTVLVIKIV